MVRGAKVGRFKLVMSFALCCILKGFGEDFEIESLGRVIFGD